MKLTNSIRYAFIQSVIADIPSVDYDQQRRDKQNALNIRIIRDKLGLPKTTPLELGWFSRTYTGNTFLADNYGPAICDYPGEETKTKYAEDIEAINDLEKLNRAQETAREALTAKVRSVVCGCATRKQLIDALPEFEKYLPAAATKTANLPAVTNLVSDLVAAGWPKDKKAAA